MPLLGDVVSRGRPLMMPEIELSERAAVKLESEKADSRFLLPPIVLCILMLWIIPMRSSFGGDEAGNWWVVKDGLRQTVARSLGEAVLPGAQSLLNNLLLVAARAIGGDSEIVLRIPALAAMLGAVFLLYRLGVRLIGPLAAASACLAFVCSKDVIYVASAVRPYALGMLFVLGAMLALLNWFDSGEARYLVIYSLLAALSVYAHYMFGLMFVVHASYAYMRLRSRDGAVSVFALVLAWSLSGAILLPLAPQVLRLFSHRGDHIYTLAPDIQALVLSFIRPFLAGTIGLGLLFALAARRRPAIEWKLPASTGWFLGIWALVPTLIVFVVSCFSGTKLFIDRYYLSSTPALALLAGALMSAIQPGSARRLVAAVMAICATIQFGAIGTFTRETPDWRNASQAERGHVGNAQTPVLLVSSFVEAKSAASFLDPDRADVLIAPQIRYPLAGRLIRLPEVLTSATETYLEERVFPTLAGKHEFLLIGLSSAAEYATWLRGRLAGDGFRLHVYGNYDGVVIFMFNRDETH
jgi:4-amino-4-deoxy-L-arabinose transferase-like glycosyltransferase